LLAEATHSYHTTRPAGKLVMVRWTKQATTEPCGFGGRLGVTSVDWVQPIDDARTEG
jgi:hypothetical protein